MERLSLELPAMYGDHHVIHVRRLLFDMEGVEEVYASSSFHLLEVDYDPDQVTPEQMTKTLEEAGYTGDLLLPEEPSIPATEQKEKAYFRHTEAYAQTKHTVGFRQTVPYEGRPLWPCPGFGPLEPKTLDVDEEEDDG